MTATKLPLTEHDKYRAKANPFGLSKCQCYTLRLICEHGGTKRAAYVAGVEARALEHHLMKARQVMGMFGNDIRMYLLWDRWIRSIDAETNQPREQTDMATFPTQTQTGNEDPS
jgi:hypothetical protein